MRGCFIDLRETFKQFNELIQTGMSPQLVNLNAEIVGKSLISKTTKLEIEK